MKRCGAKPDKDLCDSCGDRRNWNGCGAVLKKSLGMCSREGCDEPLAYAGAEYCGAACSEQRKVPKPDFAELETRVLAAGAEREPVQMMSLADLYGGIENPSELMKRALAKADEPLAPPAPGVEPSGEVALRIILSAPGLDADDVVAYVRAAIADHSGQFDGDDLRRGIQTVRILKRACVEVNETDGTNAEDNEI
jgi:hypothetical protein